ncbi:MAG: DNA cytosine methyltransferase [Erysipelotrichales bacterium]|nr:DNA cytosine methyltransferase [Erysipelotrichales bacterium]
MEKLKTISLFSGVGGIDLAFQNHNFEIIYANDFDEEVIKTYNFNFGNKATLGDITKINENDLPNCDCLIAGFPCQAFSIAGYQKGFEDTRGTLFFDIARILKQKKPKVIFLENVKNLISHDKGRTFEIIVNTLENLGYYLKYKTLNSSEYGNTPQNRERVYIVGFKSKKAYDNFNFPHKIELTRTIKDCANFETKVENKYYYTKDKYPKIVDAFKSFKNTNTIYQWRRHYVRENKNNLCPTLTANMGTGGHNIPLIITNYGLRKLTPKECFNFQGFPENYKLPDNITDSHLYKQAGNSVCVTVIDRIAEKIYLALNN